MVLVDRSKQWPRCLLYAAALPPCRPSGPPLRSPCRPNQTTSRFETDADCVAAATAIVAILGIAVIIGSTKQHAACIGMHREASEASSAVRLQLLARCRVGHEQGQQPVHVLAQARGVCDGG
jgi:hypothetical protein